MYAVIKSGGHQHCVKQGDELIVDFLNDKKEGDKVTFNEVMLVGGDSVVAGSPLVEGAVVEGVVKKQSFNEKVLVFKKRRRKDYKRTRGHKQPVTIVEISKISK